MGRRVVVATGYVKDGKLRLVSPEGYKRVMAEFPNCKVVIRIEQHKDPRSVALNAFYWAGCIARIVERTGYTDREAHALMKQLHLELSLVSMRGRGRIQDLRVFEGTTTDLSNEEEWRFIERVIQWAAETIDVVIDDPKGADVVAA